MKVKQVQDIARQFTHPENKARHSRELAESLRYASYIQQAIFPSQSLINQLLPDHFIFYQSREMVSGDFYYTSRRNNLVFIAVGDCMGHGVPGAFMSILGITFLNEIVTHGTYTGAGSILNKLRDTLWKRCARPVRNPNKKTASTCQSAFWIHKTIN